MDNHLRIRRVSKLLRGACDAYLLLRPLLAVGIWLNLESVMRSVGPFANLPMRMEFIGPVNVILGFLVTCIPMGLMMYGVWRLRQLFSLYSTGALFSLASARHLHVFASMLLVTVLTSPVIDILLSLVLTMNYPAGERAISINLGSNDLSMLFIAGVMFAIAWIMREGYLLAEENAEFV